MAEDNISMMTDEELEKLPTLATKEQCIRVLEDAICALDNSDRLIEISAAALRADDSEIGASVAKTLGNEVWDGIGGARNAAKRLLKFLATAEVSHV